MKTRQLKQRDDAHWLSLQQSPITTSHKYYPVVLYASMGRCLDIQYLLLPLTPILLASDDLSTKTNPHYFRYLSLQLHCSRTSVTPLHVHTWWHNWWYPRPHLSQTMISLSVLGCDFLQMTHRRSDSGSVSLVRSLNEDQLSVSSPNLIKHCSVTRSTWTQISTLTQQPKLAEEVQWNEDETKKFLS
jgi:hypothetical protein